MPVVCDKRDDWDVQNSRALWELCDGRIVNLTKCRRADDTLFKICQNVEKVKPQKFGQRECPKSVAYTNSVRRKVNDSWMKHRVQDGREYIEVPAVVGMGKETQNQYVYEGMPVVAISTNTKLNIANGEEFKVVSWTKKAVVVGCVLEDGSIDEDLNIEVPMDVYPRLLQPGFCISIHRSQGSTYDVPYTIYQFDRLQEMCKRGLDIGKRLLYVAMSRATDPKLINFSDKYD